MQAKESAVFEQMEAVLEYMRSNAVPRELEQRVQSYFHFRARCGGLCLCHVLRPAPGIRPAIGPGPNTVVWGSGQQGPRGRTPSSGAPASSVVRSARSKQCRTLRVPVPRRLCCINPMHIATRYLRR